LFYPEISHGGYKTEQTKELISKKKKMTSLWGFVLFCFPLMAFVRIKKKRVRSSYHHAERRVVGEFIYKEESKILIQ